MAVLAGLALQALRAGQPAAAAGPVASQQATALVDADAQRLVLRAMIAAMKADGRPDAGEFERLGAEVARKASEAGEAAFVRAVLAAPLDLDALAGGARDPASAAQAYAASIVAITIDTEAERAYVRALAGTLGLDAAMVEHLHRVTGAPRP